MGGSNKRGKSLEERLLEVRESTAPSRGRAEEPRRSEDPAATDAGAVAPERAAGAAAAPVYYGGETVGPDEFVTRMAARIRAAVDAPAGETPEDAPAGETPEGPPVIDAPAAPAPAPVASELPAAAPEVSGASEPEPSAQQAEHGETVKAIESLVLHPLATDGDTFLPAEAAPRVASPPAAAPPPARRASDAPKRPQSHEVPVPAVPAEPEATEAGDTDTGAPIDQSDAADEVAMAVELAVVEVGAPRAQAASAGGGSHSRSRFDRWAPFRDKRPAASNPGRGSAPAPGPAGSPPASGPPRSPRRPSQPKAAPEPHEDESPPEHAAPQQHADEPPWARERVRESRFGRIGNAMIERGLITNEQLDEALEIQRSSGRRVGDILVDLGALSSFELARVLADHLGVPFVDLRSKPPDPLLSTLLPEDVARRYDALPIARWNDQLVIAMVNPTDLFALDDLQLVTHQPIIAAMAVKDDLRAAIDHVYRVSKVEMTLDAASSDYGHADDDDALALEVEDGPVVGLVNALMSQAVSDQASDLHVEPCSTHISIRLRIDGVLHDASEVPLSLLRPLVSRLKILGGLDIAQTRVSQDGRFSITIQGRPVDVRVVTVPTAAGESVILRLLDPRRDALQLANLGLTPDEQARFHPAFFASQGAAIVTGPTGSGKTSTVYAVLSEINVRSKSIVSVEDPVEFKLDGIKQIQINPRAGVTFANALPSILRADPDVVFIGEVRDTETARIAADASITGHLVLSTLHATRATAAPMRLVEMGVEPYLVASALTLVVAQRLARRLCDRCAQPVDGGGHELLRELGAGESILEGASVYKAVGCPACHGTGYRGRLPLFEIMPVTEGISRLILDRAARSDLERLAGEEGMDTLRVAALRRVAHGVLSVEEMLRVIS